ncbi:MAG TPA: hypothetical protein VFB60_21820 [Ktedonobacteraceae bacterium]|nr:hypothetical protein [Ktedonobacteraceae bacterium]
MAILYIILGLMGILLASAIVVSTSRRLRPPRRGRHTTALHHALFKNEDD